MHQPDRPDHDPAAGIAAGSLFHRDGYAVSRPEFAVQTWDADYLLLGEGHASACDHRVQADLIRAMVRFGTRPVVGLEMVDVTRQGVLDRFNQGELSLDALPEALAWNATWGFDFELYAPIFETAESFGLPLRALNLPRRVIDAVKTGSVADLNATDASLVPGDIIPPSEEQQDALKEQFRQHRSLLSSAGSTLKRFFLVQSLWDTQMAMQSVAARQELARPVVVIAGSGHVERGWGIALRLDRLDPGARVVTVVPWRGMTDPDPREGDYRFYCPLSHTSRLGYTLSVSFDGIEVTAVQPDSRAAEAGLMAGDVIGSVAGEKVTALWQLHQAATQARRQGKPLEMTVVRNGEVVSVSLDPQATEPEPTAGR
ncbi:MAG: ChaN family lipoprotein [Desulfohalobiaceae bacterium]